MIRGESYRVLQRVDWRRGHRGEVLFERNRFRSSNEHSATAPCTHLVNVSSVALFFKVVVQVQRPHCERRGERRATSSGRFQVPSTVVLSSAT